jgi:hypothetical protein
MVILFDQYNLPESIFEVVFATEQQAMVGKMLVEAIKAQGGEMGKTEMSFFATKLHEGTLVETEEEHGPITKKNQVTISYNKRQFYDRILTPMRAMGMIDYDMYKKKYRLSERFTKALTKVGILWHQEVTKQH